MLAPLLLDPARQAELDPARQAALDPARQAELDPVTTTDEMSRTQGGKRAARVFSTQVRKYTWIHVNIRKYT